jgi:serpin B
MERVLHIDGLGRDAANDGYAQLLAALRSLPDSDALSVANALWLDADARFDPAFLQRDREHFGARLTTMSLRDRSAAAAAIDEWVDEQTHGRVPRLLGQLPPDSAMVLVNAVYFKGVWEEPFRKAIPGPFTSGTGETPEVPMMTHDGEMRYLETPEFQAVALPYKGSREMLVFLPSKSLGLAGFERMLSAEDWEKWERDMRPRKGMLALPRFSVDSRHEDLTATLQRLGMKSAFGPGANFSEMTGSPDLWIAQVAHGVSMSVDEKGTRWEPGARW